MNSFERFCFNLIGRRMKERREDYYELRSDMMRARMKLPFEVYISTAIVTSLIVGVVSAVILGFFTWILRIPEMIALQAGFPDIVGGISQYSLVLGTIAVVLLSFLICGGLAYLIFLMYPGIRAGERKRNIDTTLPQAISFVTAMSTAGITPAQIFRLLGESTIYGESAVEARYITREITVFGKDLVDALRSVSQTSPSDRMKDLLQGAMASISSGGNLTRYFRSKGEQYELENKQQQTTFLETLGLVAESYVTAMVAGVLFLIILQSIMSIIGGESNPMLLYVIIYLIIPFGSCMFIILVSSMTPEV